METLKGDPSLICRVNDWLYGSNGVGAAIMNSLKDPVSSSTLWSSEEKEEACMCAYVVDKVRDENFMAKMLSGVFKSVQIDWCKEMSV